MAAVPSSLSLLSPSTEAFLSAFTSFTVSDTILPAPFFPPTASTAVAATSLIESVTSESDQPPSIAAPTSAAATITNDVGALLSDYSSIIADPTEFLTPVAIPTTILLTASPSATPIGIPGSIINPNAPLYPDQPANTTLIHLGLVNPYDYISVARNTTLTNDLFDLIPLGIAYALNDTNAETMVQELQPYEASRKLNTLAQGFIPTSQVDLLNTSLHDRSSRLYTSPNASINAVMSTLDASVLLVNQTAPEPPKPIGLSTPAKIGLGVGIPIGTILLALVAFFFWRRRRRSPPITLREVAEPEMNEIKSQNVPEELDGDSRDKKHGLHEMPVLRHRSVKEMDGSEQKREMPGETGASELE